MEPTTFKKDLCTSLCGRVTVNRIPAGYAFSNSVKDLKGDFLTAYLILNEESFYLCDDGMLLNDLYFAGVDVSKGMKKDFLDKVLRRADAFIEPKTNEIRTLSLKTLPSADMIINFLDGLSHAQDVIFLNEEK